MDYNEFLALGVRLRDGIIPEKFVQDIIDTADKDCALKVFDLFKSHGYDLSLVPGSFYKIFTKSDKKPNKDTKSEIEVLEDVLTAIDEMDFQISENVSLKTIFQTDLRYMCFTPTFIARLKFCIANNFNFAYEDNTFINEMFTENKYTVYTSAKPISQLKTASELESDYAPFAQNSESLNTMNSSEPIPLVDEEDLSVRTEIIHTLTLAQMNNQGDKNFDYLITNIIANLNDVIALDNKQYRILGTRHLVENALQGVNITPEVYNAFDESILQLFPDTTEVKEEGVRR